VSIYVKMGIDIVNKYT